MLTCGCPSLYQSLSMALPRVCTRRRISPWVALPLNTKRHFPSAQEAAVMYVVGVTSCAQGGDIKVVERPRQCFSCVPIILHLSWLVKLAASVVKNRTPAIGSLRAGGLGIQLWRSCFLTTPRCDNDLCRHPGASLPWLGWCASAGGARGRCCWRRRPGR